MSADEVEESGTSLFRVAACEAQRTKWHGEIVLSQPLTYRYLALGAVVIAVIVLLFGAFGTYTKRTTVVGQITPSAGLLKLYAQQAGIVVEAHVREGQEVAKGDVLFVLSGERTSSTMGGTQEAVSHQVQAQKETLSGQMRDTERLGALEREGLEGKLQALRQDIGKLDSLTAGQRDRVMLAEQALARYEQLLPQGFVTQDHVIQKKSEFLDQRTRLKELERERIGLAREIAATRNQLDTLPLKYGNELGEISRSLASAEQQLSESEARRRLVVIATESGTATATNAHLGQSVTSGAPLVTIIPLGSNLLAHLYAPSRAIGFVRAGDQVRLRYEAFPYQKFGQYEGRVANVSRIAMSSEELTGSNVFASGGPPGGEPLYRITVDLGSNFITSAGRTLPLEPGMLLEADILQEKRYLYEWALEPLYSVIRKL